MLDEENKLITRVKNIKNDNENLINALLEKNKIVPQAIENLNNYENIEERLKNKQVI